MVQHIIQQNISLIGSLPNIELYNPSNSLMMKHIVAKVYKVKTSVVRMDRRFAHRYIQIFRLILARILEVIKNNYRNMDFSQVTKIMRKIRLIAD